MLVVKEALPDKKVRKHQIIRGLIVRDSTHDRKYDGSTIKYDVAAAVGLRRDGQPLAKRILGPVSRDLRKMGHSKIISISTIAL